MSEPTVELDYLTIGYAAFIFIEGVLGYLRANSVPSLLAGLGFSALMGLGAYRVANHPRHWCLLLFTNYLLAGVMGKRFAKSEKMYPAGYITLISCLMVLRFLVRALVNQFGAKQNTVLE